MSQYRKLPDCQAMVTACTARPAWGPPTSGVKRGSGWLKHWRRVATLNDKCVHCGLGFLYLTAAWIWLDSNVNTNW